MEERETPIPPPSEQESEKMWNNTISNIRKQEKEKKKNRIFRLSAISMVAVLLLIGSVITYRTLMLPDLYIAKDRDLKIRLADGSQITLLKGARLKVDKSFPSATRDVLLEGDALFQVAKSKTHPFIVHGKGYETKVLGTTFKVTQTGKTFNVDLYEGKVEVVNIEKPKEVFVLHPKETFTNLGMAKVATVVASKNQEKSLDTQTATLSFDNTNLADVMKVLEQTFGIKIKYPHELGNQKISITKEKTTPIEVIKLISLKLDLDDKTFELEE